MGDLTLLHMGWSVIQVMSKGGVRDTWRSRKEGGRLLEFVRELLTAPVVKGRVSSRKQSEYKSFVSHEL